MYVAGGGWDMLLSGGVDVDDGWGRGLVLGFAVLVIAVPS